MATFVLIHGAYQGGWIWQPVARRLRAAGHTVYAPTLEGCAERRHGLRSGITTETHAQEIADLLFFEDLQDVVLVGTSSGGMVMARAAEQARACVARLVFADALALLNGEKIIDIVKQPAAVNTDLGRGPTKTDAAGRMFKNLEPKVRDWAAERVTLHPIGCFASPVKLDSFWQQSWKASVLYCSGAPNPGEAHIRRTADLLKGRWHVLDTGHYPMLSTPDQLTEIILEG